MINKGLDGINADVTKVSNVIVEEKKLFYRGYDIESLCDNASFLEVAYLLLYGKLPTLEEFTVFEEMERENREVPEMVYDVFNSLPKKVHPMDVMRLGVELVSMFDSENQVGQPSLEKVRQQAILLLFKLPTILANGYRAVHDLPLKFPNPNLSYSENFLSMILGRETVDEAAVKVFDTSLVLYAEHGFNASTFAARVTAATLSDYYSAIVTAIGTLKGPLHGGANEAVMALLNEIGSVDRAEPVIMEKLKNKEKIMGFGHRLYRLGDSRVERIKKLGVELAQKMGDTRLHDIGQVVEDIMVTKKNIFPNLDFPAAMAYSLLGIPIPLFTPLFVASRVTGWSAHLLEQYANNRLIRPSCVYEGPSKQQVLPIGQRS